MLMEGAGLAAVNEGVLSLNNDQNFQDLTCECLMSRVGVNS